MRDYQLAVIIGRFQPFHLEHVKLLEKGLEIADKVLVITGSYRVAPTIKNPFTWEERAEMIASCVPDNRRYDVVVAGVRDYYYSDVLWCADVQRQTMTTLSKVFPKAAPGRSVALVGTYKDSSSFYLQYFPQWDFVPVKMESALDAMQVRNSWYAREKAMDTYNVYHPLIAKETMTDQSWRQLVPQSIADWLDEKYFPSPRYHHHCNEFEYYRTYNRKYGSGPFNTVDSIVTCHGHVLVVTRKDLPGKGLYALPGGFMKDDERLLEGAIRELKEETGFPHDKTTFKKNLVGTRVFDYPGRSLRARIITHAYHFALDLPELPEVHAGSDADACCWLPICDVYLNDDRFFEDHFHIINHFVTRG